MTDEMTGLAGATVSFTGRLASMTQREGGALVRRCGGRPVSDVSGRTTHLVVGMQGWPMFADGRLSRKLEQAERLAEQGSPIEIISEQRFLELAGRRPAPRGERKQYSREQVCDWLGIKPGDLARWEQLGLVRSAEGRFDFQDLVTFRTLLGLLARGVRPDTISRSLLRLQGILPEMDRPLAQLELIAGEGEVLVQRERQVMTASGQLLLDFDSAEEPEPAAEPVPLSRPAASADNWFERGIALEDEKQWAEAAEAYRKALEIEPGFPEALFNLGNVSREMGDVVAAIRAYGEAIDADPQWTAPRYNLAGVLAGAGDVDEAVLELERVIAIAPTFADAHFNLAWCLQRIGRLGDACRHWQTYLGLDPVGPWALRARQHLREATGQPPAEPHVLGR
ncbi:MAG: tetratricopeptide repeat protein [Phycisphaeraceae bacterium]